MSDGFVVLGYVVTYGSLAAYAASLWVRGRRISSKTEDG